MPSTPIKGQGCAAEKIVIRTAVPADAASIAAIHEIAVHGERGRGDYDDGQIEAWAHPRTLAELRERIGSRRFFIAESPSEPVAVLGWRRQRALALPPETP